MMPIPHSGADFTDGLGIDFVELRPGSFLMGSPEGEAGRDADERLHAVELTRRILIGRTPVTQRHWMQVMGTNPSRFFGDALPVDNVAWSGAAEFCARMSRREGVEYRLPTEAEWEFACRAGTRSAFAFSNDRILDLANVAPQGRAAPGPTCRTSVVRHYPANAWGIFDMHGNVWEWCSDFYGEYDPTHASDPIGPARGTYRVVRGGAWFIGADWARSASRFAAVPDRPVELGASGFRVVRAAG